MCELYFGDDPEILRAHVQAASVKLLYPDLARGGHTFRQAKREGGDGKQAGLFGV